MVINTKKVRIVKEEWKEEFSSVSCDFCGKEFKYPAVQKAINIDYGKEAIFWAGLGLGYTTTIGLFPVFSHFDPIVFHVCPKCFREKIVPLVEENHE